MTPDSQKIMEQLRQIKPLLKEKWGVSRLRVFGSVARGEAGPESDVDSIIEFEKPVGLFEMFDVTRFMEDKLGREVDLCTSDSILKPLKQRILAEAADV